MIRPLKMAACVYCCVYALPKWERIKLTGLSLNETVDDLRAEISRQSKVPASELFAVFCGRRLNESVTLTSCGIKSGTTLHMLRRHAAQEPLMSPEKVDCSEVGLQRLVMALKTAIRNPAYRTTVQRLSKQDVMENIIAATPGLAADPIAIAILQDPDLLMQFTDVATIHRVVETHPALADAINHVVAAVHEESSTLNGNSLPLPAAYSYLLDALSDEDDIDPSHSEQAGSSGTSQTPNQGEFPMAQFSAITPAQLASALAAVATANTPGTSSTSDSSANGTMRGFASSVGQSTPIISTELFSQAMQQALSSTTQCQLQQLRDMGITDDAASLRALQITNGDVQAALELIFGDITGN